MIFTAEAKARFNGAGFSVEAKNGLITVEEWFMRLEKLGMMKIDHAVRNRILYLDLQNNKFSQN